MLRLLVRTTSSPSTSSFWYSRRFPAQAASFLLKRLVSHTPSSSFITGNRLPPSQRFTATAAPKATRCFPLFDCRLLHRYSNFLPAFCLPTLHTDCTAHNPTSTPTQLTSSPSSHQNQPFKEIESGGSLNGWLGGVSAAVVLLGIAIAFKENDDDSCLRKDSAAVPEESHGVAAVDIWERVIVMCDSFRDRLSRFFAKASEAATSMAILVQCVNAVLFTKGEDYPNDVALRWKLRVTSLLADLAASSHSRRRALIQAGNGSVIDWLLEGVSHVEQDYRMIQAEAARALSHFLSDDITCDVVLGRVHAISHLLSFTASILPNMITKNARPEKSADILENNERTRGRSMLVAALMDIVTSSCETLNKSGLRPKLSGLADSQDISAALMVLKEGSLDESQDDEGGEKAGDDSSIHGLGSMSSGEKDDDTVQSQKLLSVREPNWTASGWRGSSSKVRDTKLMVMGTASKNSMEIIDGKRDTDSHGLWDDLHGKHVAVPFAAWAIATWAEASSTNCSKIARLDKEGNAILAAVMAPERTVKLHGAIAARHVIKNGFTELAGVWTSALLETARQASEMEDAQLALISLDSFNSCVTESPKARELVSEGSLPLLREIAKQTIKINSLQEIIAKILEILSLGSGGLSPEEGKKWSSILLYWTFNCSLAGATQLIASKILAHLLDELGPAGVPLSEAWLALVTLAAVNGLDINPAKADAPLPKGKKSKSLVQGRASQMAIQAANELARVVWLSIGEVQGTNGDKMANFVPESQWGELANLDILNAIGKGLKKGKGKPSAAVALEATVKALKALTELSTEDTGRQRRIIEAGGLHLLRRFILNNDYERLFALEAEPNSLERADEDEEDVSEPTSPGTVNVPSLKGLATAHLRKHAARMLSILSLQPLTPPLLEKDEAWFRWLEDCANNQIPACSNDLKMCSYARATLLNLNVAHYEGSPKNSQDEEVETNTAKSKSSSQYGDRIFIVNTSSPLWGCSDVCRSTECRDAQEGQTRSEVFDMDVVFVHGLCGGPFKTWRIADVKVSSTDRAALVEKIDMDSGKEGTCWPKEWLSVDVPACRLLTVKYKTNLSQWSGSTLPLQEVSAMLLEKLWAAGVGERPVVFITHSMGGLVVKQMLMQAMQEKKFSNVIKNTSGIVFYSCPHFGSKLADMPWRFGLVLRPAPSIGELRSGSTRLEELNQFIRTLHKGGLDILSFSETKVTPLVEGYGGWALRMEVVPIESAYPGFGELVVLDGTDHVTACKPLNRDDLAYTQTLQFLQQVQESIRTSGNECGGKILSPQKISD